MAAKRSGIHTVLIPKDNVRDLEEIDQTVRAALRFVSVESVDQVFAEALLPEAEIVREEPRMPVFAPLSRENAGGDALRQ